MIVTPETAPAQRELAAAISTLARSASIETAARNLAEIDAYASLVPAGTDVYATWLPRMPYHHLVSVSRRLRQVGMNPVPHITPRQLASREAAEDFLGRLRDEALVTRVLLVAGDAEAPVGPYESSAAFLETGLLESHGIRSVGIAGYPEGHPRISEAALATALERKIESAADRGIDLFVVSQFCFDGQAILDWLARLRARGVTAPVRVGVAGPATVRALLNYAVRCGIGNSIRALRTQAISLPRLLAEHGPDRVVRRLAEGGAGLGIAGLHCFPFGGFARGGRWLGAVAAGQFAPDDAHGGLAVHD
ncbi:MAG TPA: methylenetetrahydrofolate reductase [Burkholderiales bacterium]|nr:methylenetetrahydrofolate reductase [Burkholderiales bacterium]